MHYELDFMSNANAPRIQNSIVDSIKTFLPLLTCGFPSSESVFTSVGISPSQENFAPLTPFETILLGLVLLQILVMQLFGLIPFDLNKVLRGEYTPSFGNGFATFMKIRKKRDTGFIAGADSDISLLDKIFDILILVDRHECVLKSLCEVQKHTQFYYKPPMSLHTILSTLSYTFENEVRNSSEVSFSKIKVIDSMITGKKSNSISSKDCEQRYFACPLSTLDIMSYIEIINLDDFT